MATYSEPKVTIDLKEYEALKQRSIDAGAIADKASEETYIKVMNALNRQNFTRGLGTELDGKPYIHFTMDYREFIKHYWNV